MTTTMTGSNQGGVLLSSSPNSSEEVDSTHATPATKLSSVTPKDGSDLFKIHGSGISRSKVPPAFQLSVNNHDFSKKPKENSSVLTATSQDPFVMSPLPSAISRSSTEMSKLSPVANAFTPLSQIHSGSNSSVGDPVSASGVLLSASTRGFRQSGFGLPHVSSQKFNSQLSPIGDRFNASNMPSGAQSPASDASLRSFDVYLQGETGSSGRAFSSNEGTSRSIVIQVPPKTDAKEVHCIFNSKQFTSLKIVDTTEFVRTGLAFVRLDDIRDIDDALVRVGAFCPNWKVCSLIKPALIERANRMWAPQPPVFSFEGQVLVSVSTLGSSEMQNIDAMSLGRLVHDMLRQFGQLMLCLPASRNSNTLYYRAEFFSHDDAKAALIGMDGLELKSFAFHIAPYECQREGRNLDTIGSVYHGPADVEVDQIESLLGGMDIGKQATVANNSFTANKVSFGKHTPTPIGNSWTATRNNVQNHSIIPSYSTARPFLPQSSLPSPPFSPGAIGQERQAAFTAGPLVDTTHHPGRNSVRPRTRQHNDFAGNHHNVVDVHRIAHGLDVRTTIMLRNIPNKIDQAMLKEIVDETSFGKFDFMYLRIDFANNCNVGYAFINFEDPIHIIEFVQARAGKQWNRFNSEKVAEVSYATIQGKDCLIQKFRNSSVMLEHASFRPKLFFTGMGPLAGKEDTFPGPDNNSKLRRSVENASHVGLFAPRAGQTFRNEQRCRRSQYDRGTRMAQLEDECDAMLPMPSGEVSLHRADYPHFDNAHF